MLARRARLPCPRLPSARSCSCLRPRPPATPLGARRLASTATAGCPYEVLGVERGCSEAELKKAFRLAAKRHHPDTQQGADAAEAEQRFKQVESENRQLRSELEKKEQFQNAFQSNNQAYLQKVDVMEKKDQEQHEAITGLQRELRKY